MQGLHIGQHIFARRLCQSPALCLIRLFISKSSTMVSGQFFRGLPAFPSACPQESGSSFNWFLYWLFLTKHVYHPFQFSLSGNVLYIILFPFQYLMVLFGHAVTDPGGSSLAIDYSPLGLSNEEIKREILGNILHCSPHAECFGISGLMQPQPNVWIRQCIRHITFKLIVICRIHCRHGGSRHVLFYMHFV